ncbi:hypothetical protein [Hymenobacter terrestris]|uniref:TIGR04255 family protein n=1 Tax=Hymenobacter terrestris TaxID=2748310 RepID=A0ABX2Q7L9_9BACT|nr:hypothetical protein [Hymenobacter terrestris]NVO86426.1 hypothetical protein [Hymenobacter terrestris]
MPDKQSRELYLLERFLPQLLEGKPYRLIQPAPPLPDVIVQLGEKSIGIEITLLIPDEQVRQREATQEAILDEAQKIFEARHQLPLQITVDFVETADWLKLNRRHVADFLAKTIEQSVLAAKGIPQNQLQFDLRVDQSGHPHIQSIGIFYLDRLTQSCWSPITSFWVPNVPAQVVQKIIHRKSRNIGGYMTGCDDVWLLMLETGSPSSYFDGFEKLEAVSFTSAFARTMIGRISKGELIMLHTEPIT